MMSESSFRDPELSRAHGEWTHVCVKQNGRGARFRETDGR